MIYETWVVDWVTPTMRSCAPIDIIISAALAYEMMMRWVLQGKVIGVPPEWVVVTG